MPYFHNILTHPVGLDLGKTFVVLAAIVLIPAVSSQSYSIPEEAKPKVLNKIDQEKQKIEEENSTESEVKSYPAILLEAVRKSTKRKKNIFFTSF